MLSQIELQSLPFRVIGFAARSGTGKTTLLKKLIPELKLRGLRVGLIKHTHHAITFDNAGLTKKVFGHGADVIATSPEVSIAEWHQSDAQVALIDGIMSYKQLPIDILLIEGFKKVGFPKIELHRAELQQPLMHPEDTHIVAVATDDRDSIGDCVNVPVVDINTSSEIADWIERYIDSSDI
ncbi:MAG: molybdopterin-guanine dinucleotide biosynthesis protein B [Gammaproteobacteria bacterium]|nr:molybdopterin-guanine dinucleotide biosynthesis protein B [Gammaproteobacteria bacterium]